MPPKYVTQRQFSELKKTIENLADSINETKALTFDLKDNHLKHITSDIHDLEIQCARMDEKIDVGAQERANISGKVWVVIGISTASFVTILSIAIAILSKAITI